MHVEYKKFWTIKNATDLIRVKFFIRCILRLRYLKLVSTKNIARTHSDVVEILMLHGSKMRKRALKTLFLCSETTSISSCVSPLPLSQICLADRGMIYTRFAVVSME